MIIRFITVPALQNLLQDEVEVQAKEHGAAYAPFGLKNKNRPRKIPTRTVAFLIILPIRVGPSLKYNTQDSDCRDLCPGLAARAHGAA